MVLIFFLSVLLFIVSENVKAEPYFYNSSSSQTTSKQTKKLNKDQRKRARKVKREDDFKEVAEALKNRDWVLMSNKLYTPGGKTLDIKENKNCFIQVKGEIVYIQLAFNGLHKDDYISGLTLQGTPYNIESSSDKYGNITYSFDVDGHNLSAMVKIQINYNDNYAQVTIHPNMNRKSISLSGWILPREKACFYTSGYVNY